MQLRADPVAQATEVPPQTASIVYRAQHEWQDDGWTEEPLEQLRGASVIAVAGVAGPGRFVGTLRTAGATVADVLTFPDHHAYTPSDAARIAALAGERLVVTTEKDLVKLERLPTTFRLRALRVCLEVDDAEALLDLLAT